MGAKLGGGGGGGRYDLHQNSDINVTPFVDVMLVLLIIFMVSAPMATVSIKLDLPPPTNPPKDRKKPVFIQILKTGEIYIVTRKTSLDSLPGDLAQELAVPNPRAEQVMVKADADVDYGTFMGVLNRLEEAGYFKVGLISENIT